MTVRVSYRAGRDGQYVSVAVILMNCVNFGFRSVSTGVLVSPWPYKEGNKLQRNKFLSFMYPIYNHNWRNISTIYVHITRPASNEIF
jgi:hypothetical protein